MAKLIEAAHSVFTSAKTGYGLPIEVQENLDYGDGELGEALPLDELIMSVYKDEPAVGDEDPEDVPQQVRDSRCSVELMRCGRNLPES